jgi:parvulin-like peptidyl-prolyl cis-trans isomerase-like protein
MSTVLPRSLLDRLKLSLRRASPPQSWPTWAREPLFHFVVLGALLFAADYFIVGRADDPRTIVVDAAVDAEAIKVFKNARGRDPNKDELYALRRVWLDNEVLYREGLALQVDRGDSAIRERVIFKALSVVDSNLKAPPVDEKVLREWFEANRVKYDEPARFDFQEAVLAGGENSEGAVRTFVDTLRTGKGGELNAGLRVYKGRPHSNIVQGYGEEFAKSLEESPPGAWRAFSTRDGWRAMQLDAVTPPKPADFDVLRGVVLQDWVDAKMSEQRSAAVRALARKYKIKYEEAK